MELKELENEKRQKKEARDCGIAMSVIIGSLVTGFAICTVKACDSGFTRRDNYGVHIQQTLPGISYHEENGREKCVLILGHFPKKLKMHDTNCDGSVNKLENMVFDARTTKFRNDETEQLFQEDDKKYAEILQEYKFKERAAELWKREPIPCGRSVEDRNAEDDNSWMWHAYPRLRNRGGGGG